MNGPLFVRIVSEKKKTFMNVDVLDVETTRMVQTVVILRKATKHINLWTHQRETKTVEICELA